MQNNFSKGNLTVLLIVLVAALGVLAIFAFGIFDKGTLEKTQEPPKIVDLQVQEFNTLSTSDELGEIESDLNNTDLDAIDQELSQMDREMEGL